MSKWTFKGNYNINRLNIIIKYKKTKKDIDRFITRDGILTDQKVYTGRSFKSLINYLKKEGNNFQSKKEINEFDGVKHLIVSPIDPVLYNQLNEEEKKKLQDIVVQTMFKNLARFGFFGAIEKKDREINGQKYDHFHLHLAINSRYDISLKNINFLKRQIANNIYRDPVLRKKLGLKSKSELLREKNFERNKNLYQEKFKTAETLKILFMEFNLINHNLKLVNQDLGESYECIKDLSKERKNELTRIYRNKTLLKFDIKTSKEILKNKYESVANINKELGKTFEFFNREKNSIFNQMKEDLNNLKTILIDDFKYFKNVLGWEHNIYVKFLKYQLKNKQIDIYTFLYLIANNKYYLKNRLKYRKEEINQKIKEREEEYQKRIKSLNEKLKNEINRLQNDKKYKMWSIEFEKSNLKNLIKEMKKLNNQIKDINELYFKKMDLFKKFIEYKQQEYKKLLEMQMKKEREIQREKLNKILIDKKIKENNQQNYKEIYENEPTEIQKEIQKEIQETKPLRKRKIKFGM